jgi:mannose-6-phosphate isomerase-like protein (cupin superfamily)
LEDKQKHNALEDAKMLADIFVKIYDKAPLAANPFVLQAREDEANYKFPSGRFFCKATGKNAKERDENKVTRFSERTNAINSDLDFYSLAQNKADRHMDPFVIDIFPASEEEVKLSSHEGEEFIYVLEGKVEIQYGKDTYKLEVGDSLYYDSIVAHHVHSHEGKAKILAVVYTPV